MSIAIPGCPNALYSPAQDHAVSPAGMELRESVRTALAPPRPRTTHMLERINYALQKGTRTEGTLVGVEPFGRMVDFLAILPADIPLPEVVVEAENQIGLDWSEGPRRVLSLTVDDTPYLGFAALLGHEPLHGRVPFAGEIPETVAYLFARLYPSPVRSGSVFR